MADKNKSNITSRDKLKKFFERGDLPTQEHFIKLIDSTLNKADDQLDIDQESGLILYPQEKDDVLSIFKYNNKDQGKWRIAISKDKSLVIEEKVGPDERLDPDAKKDSLSLYLQSGGRIGVGINDPFFKLHVDGHIASHGHIGCFLEKTVDADSKWHNVFDKHLEGCWGFDVMAFVEGGPKTGKYSLLNATALSTYGNSKPSIRKNCAYYGKWWNKIDVRWESRPSILEDPAKDKWWKRLLFREASKLKYNLQMRTKSNYGEGKKIYIRVSKIWDESMINTSEQSE